MRRVLALVLALALAAPACAQIYPGYGTPTLLGDGSASAPAYSFASAPGLGFLKYDGAGVAVTNGAGTRTIYLGGSLSLISPLVLQWTNSASDPNTTADTVLKRASAGTLGVNAGGTTSAFANVGGVLSVDTTSTGTTGAGTSTIKTYTLPASVLNVNGKGLRITAQGTTANNVNAKTVSIQFCNLGGTAITLPASAFSAWRIETLWFRTGSNAQNGYTRGTVDAGTTSTQQTTAASTHTCTDTGTIAVLIQGSGTATNDVTSALLMVELLN